MMYSATAGVYTHTNRYERDTDCPVCGAGAALPLAAGATLGELLAELRGAPIADALGLDAPLQAPSVSAGDEMLYMTGPLEATYHARLDHPLADLLEAGALTPGAVLPIAVTDASQARPLKVRIVVAGGDGDAMEEAG